MIALALCGLAFAGTYFVARRSAVGGFIALLVVGYFYGILRANFPGSLGYFIFDAAVIAYFVTLPWNRLGGRAGAKRSRQLEAWLILLIGWPVILLLVPVQDPLVQLVGLRSHVMLLPIALIGARFSREDLDRVAVAVAVLNIVVFGFAFFEFLLGVDRFYPRNAVTELIYMSNDATSRFGRALRLPATFVNAAAFGATMTMTLPLLVGGWAQRSVPSARRLLFGVAAFVSFIGVFMAASRLPMLILGGLMVVMMFSSRLGMAARAGWALMLVGVGWIVANNERFLYRLTTLTLDSALERFGGSVNRGLIELLFDYPLGNGLGGGGTNMPGFAANLLRNPVYHESQYAVFFLELGLPGLLLWLLFIAWVLTRPGGAGPLDRWHLGHRLFWWACAAHLASGLIGIGFLTSVPFSVLLLFGVGWLVGHAYDRPESSAVATPPTMPGEVAPAPRVGRVPFPVSKQAGAW